MAIWHETPEPTYHFFAVFVDHLGEEHPIPRAIHDPGRLYTTADACISAIRSAWVRAATARPPYSTPFIVREIRVTQEGRPL